VAWLADETDEYEEVEGQLRFLHGGVRMICLHDVRSDRLRLVAAVTEESALTIVTARILLQANFGNTLDARYAIRDGTLYAVYLTRSTLVTRDLNPPSIRWRTWCGTGTRSRGGTRDADARSRLFSARLRRAAPARDPRAC
jgi:hypothetical protein